MQVFNTFLKVAIKKIPSIITYVVVFFTVSVVIVSINTSDKAIYEAARLSIIVFDDDKTDESRAFVEYLSRSNDVIEKEMTEKELTSELFYRSADYALTINEGYAQKLQNGETDGLFTSVTLPSTFSSAYADTQINQYIGIINMYRAGGCTLSEAIAKASVQEVDTEITVESFSEGEGTFDAFAYNYYRLLPYLFMTVIITGVSSVIVAIRKRVVRERMMCAPLSGVSFSSQLILGTIAVSFIVWLFMVIASALIIGVDILMTLQGGLIILNSFVFMLVSVALAVLVCSFLSGNNNSTRQVQSVIIMISNIVSLGMSFLCGIFVPQELMGDGVATIARFMPAYWYIQAIDSIAQMGGKTFDISSALSSMGIQLLFAMAIISVSLVISKVRKTA